jgi:hypothetical protein
MRDRMEEDGCGNVGGNAMLNKRTNLARILCFFMIMQMLLSLFSPYQSEVLAAQADVIKVNFQPAAAAVPSGFIADSGELYGLHNGIRYGWNTNHMDATVSRNTYQPNLVWDTFVRFHANGLWELEVENGQYDVAVSIGDSLYGSTNTVVVENTTVWSSVYVPAGQHAAEQRTVQVTDGKLTVSQGGAGDVGTAINSIEITKQPAVVNVLASETPQIGSPPERRAISGNKVLISGSMTNEHNAPEYIRVDGLKPEIDRYMSEQLQSVNQTIVQYESEAEGCSGCDVSAILQKIAASGQSPVVVKAGQLNMASSVVLGSPSKPVVLIVDGINMNQNITIDVYGTLIVKGGLNANTQLAINMMKPQPSVQLSDGYGSLWVTGTMHLNHDASIHIANQLYAGTLTYNSGLIDVKAKRILVEDRLHINTQVDMNVEEEIAVGELVSNNQTGNLHVAVGDLFVRDNISVNNHLSIKTGGVFAVGGSMTANQKPLIETGAGGEGQTLLKYKLHGLKAEYFAETSLSGDELVKMDDSIHMTSTPILSLPGLTDNQFSVRWTGQLEPRYSEAYTFDVAAAGGIKLWINNELWVDQWSNYTSTTHQPVLLEAGKRYNIKLEYVSTGNPQASVYWQSASQQREVLPKSQLYPFGTPVVQFNSTETTVTLHWQPIFNADGYEIERDSTIVSMAAGSSYIHEPLLPGTQHTYRMRANTVDMAGEWTLLTSYWTLPVVPLVSVPTNLQSSATDASVQITWDAVSGAIGYALEADGIVIGNLLSLSYLHTGLQSNTNHSYRVRAYNNDGISNWSSSIEVTTLPGIPQQVAAAASDHQIVVSWDGVLGASDYEIEVDGVVVSTGTQTNYTHSGLALNSEHAYRIRAHNDKGYSQWSHLVKETTLSGIPNHVRATTTNDSVTLTWDVVLGASGYDVEADGAVVDSGVNSTFVHSGLLAGSDHAYRVRARSAGGAGEWSAVTSARTLSTSETPYIGPPPEQRTITGNKVLISGSIINEYNAPPYTRLDGLKQEIDRYMSEQLQSVNQAIVQYESAAEGCSRCDVNGILQKIAASGQSPALVRAGHLNMDSSAVFGSPNKPVVLIVDGINTNQSITINVYGTLIVKGELNANRQLAINTMKPQLSTQLSNGNGSLWVTGTMHLNHDASIHIANQLYAGTLTYNNGLMDVKAKRILVKDHLHINTQVDMGAEEEIAVGELVSNNQTANLHVAIGDLFVRDNISVNNQLSIHTGGWFAVGGSMTSNQKPLIETGAGGEGQTWLKYKLHGLKAEYFTESNLSGDVLIRVDDSIHMTKAPILSLPGLSDNQFSVSWTGQLEPRYSEPYTFDVAANGGVRLWINDELWVDQWSNYTGIVHQPVLLEAGNRYNIKLEYASKGNPQVNVYWQSASQQREVVPKSRLYPFGTPVVQFSATETEVTLQWDPIFNADGYEVERDGRIVPIAAASVYIHEPLLPGTLHTYRLRANSVDLIGEWTQAIRYWTLPAVPQNIHLTSTSHTIALDWEEVTGATGYEIEVNNDIVDNGNAIRYQESNLNPNMPKTFRVRAKNSSGVGKWSPLLVKSTIVAVPTNLQSQAADISALISWDAVSGAAGYDLEVDGVVIGNLTSPSYLHAGLQSNTSHTYRIRAFNNEGSSNWSLPIEVTALPGIPQHAAVAASDYQIVVSWEGVLGAIDYEIEVDGVVVSGGTETRYAHTGLVLNSEHTYRIRASNGKVYSQWTNLVKATTLSGIPNNVRAAPTSDSVTLTWDIVIGASGYDVEADGVVIDNGIYLTFVHSGLLPSSDHAYRIRARSAGGIGAWSTVTTARTIFGQPQNLRAAVTNTSLHVAWDAVPGAEGYDIFVDGDLMDNGNLTTYAHTGLTPFSWHVYRVRAKYNGAVGEWSSPLTQATALGTPGNIQVTPASQQITINWDVVNGAAGYEVEADGTIMVLGVVTAFVHNNLPPNSTHTYRIRATNELGAGEWSGQWSDKTSSWTPPVPVTTAPDVPRNLKAASTTNSITVSWDSAAGASSYDLEVDGLVTSSSGTSYTQTGLEPNTMHVYKVRSHNSKSQSGWSEQLKKVTTPALILNLEKDTEFNFIVVVPKKVDISEREITVTYNADDVDVLDLSLLTPELETAAGNIQGTNMTVVSFDPGKIVYHVHDVNKTVLNGIRFWAKVNQYSQITYTIN